MKARQRVKRIALFAAPLLAFLVLAAFLMRGLSLNPRALPSPLIGKPAPVFELPNLHVPNTAFASRELLGQVWVFNVWASWCAPCRTEHPLWNEFARDKHAVLIGLNYKDEPDRALGWLKELGDPYAMTVADRDGRLGIDFGVYGVPETFVIDQKGVIRYKHIGPVTRKDLQENIIPCVQSLKSSPADPCRKRS